LNGGAGGWYKAKQQDGNNWYGPYKIGEIANPARKYFMTERPGEWQDVPGRFGHYTSITAFSGGIRNYENRGSGVVVFPVHNRRVPTSFLDAHVEAIPGPIVGPQGPDGYLPLWPTQ
jgi:hypothetical protein